MKKSLAYEKIREIVPQSHNIKKMAINSLKICGAFVPHKYHSPTIKKGTSHDAPKQKIYTKIL